MQNYPYKSIVQKTKLINFLFVGKMWNDCTPEDIALQFKVAF